MTLVAVEHQPFHVEMEHGQPAVTTLIASAARPSASHDPDRAWMPQASVVAVLGVAGLAWWKTVTDAHRMSSMADGVAKADYRGALP
jgi:hypothetical protein